MPADLEGIVLACLAKNRDARPPSAAILRTALLACADADRYDMPAARAWWQAWRTSLAGPGTGARLPRADGSRPATMAIDLGGRNTEALTPVL